MNTKQVFFEKDIPYSSLEKLGISKMDILSLDKKNIEALLSGKRTNVFDMKGVDDKGRPFELKGKISLYRNSDNRVSINIHPVRKEIKNDIGLKDDEIDKLKKGVLMPKNINGEKYLVQLDKDTNEILKVKLKNIIVPSHIKDVELNSEQKNRLKLGQPITIESGKEKLQVGIDLNNPKGLTITNEAFEMKKKIDFDYHNPHIIGTIQTDKNREEFTEYHKKQGNKLKNN